MLLVLFVALWATLCLMSCSNSKNTRRALSAYLDWTHLRLEISLLGPWTCTHCCSWCPAQSARSSRTCCPPVRRVTSSGTALATSPSRIL